MKIEQIRIKNYKSLQNVTIDAIPNMAVFLGQNGTGKTTLFDVFGFLYDALQGTVKSALAKRGQFKEVISRGQSGDIEFVIKFRPSKNEPLITYELKIGLNEKGEPTVKNEILKFRWGSNRGKSPTVMSFKNGKGIAIPGDISIFKDGSLYERTEQVKENELNLDSPDILAIKGIGQFGEYYAVSKLRRLIEDWYVSDFHIEDVRSTRDAGYSEHLSTTGDNLALVTKYMYDSHREKFDEILRKMEKRIPGIMKVEATETTDGRIVLRFQDGSFKDPFISRFVSDGTIKMFTYLVLLGAPEKRALLCVEEPENQLYPQLLSELAEEFREYAINGGQVFISTHSPDFLNAVELHELYCLNKKDGYTQITKASDDALVKSLYEGGDKLGALWRQNLLMIIHNPPQWEE